MTLRLEDLYETRIDSTRSINYYSGFDCYCDAVFFSLCDGDTGEELKSYEVSFDEDTGEVDYDVEFTSEHDSGYCDFRRLPKSVREHVLAIVKAYIEEQAEEYSEEEAEESEEMEEKAEMFKLIEVDTKDFTEEQQAQFIEGWVLAGGYIDDLKDSPAPWCCPWHHGNTKIKVFGPSPKSWGAQWWAQCKDEITGVM